MRGRPEGEHVNRRLVLLVVGVGTLLSAMAGSSITVALPALSADLDITIDRASWVMLAYLLTVTVLLLVAGRSGDLFGHQRVYLAGFVLFGVGSLACGLAQGLWLVVLARVFQGVGGAMLMATGPALLTTTFPGSERGKALGMLATATYTGLTIGPPLGGLLISHLSWRWVFFLNIPIVAVVLGLGLFFLPSRDRSRAVPFDAGGALSLMAGMPLVLLAVAQGQRWGWLSWPVLASAAAGSAFLFAFIAIENRREHPLLRLALFRSRVFSGAAASAVGNYVALFVQIILLPFYLMEALGIEASRAGLVLSAQPLIMALVASPAGRLSDRIGSRGLAVSGMLILAAGLLGASTLGPGSGTGAVAGWLAVMGLGTGVFISPNSSALMGAAPRDMQGTAGGVMAVARNLGMMVGVALATAVFQAAGGQTGGTWRPDDYRALTVSFTVAAGVALLGAVAAALGQSGQAGPVSRK